MAKSKLKKNDPVVLISGRRGERGKTSKLLKVLPDKQRVVVEKLNLIKEFVRPNPQKNIKGGVVEREAPVAISKVMYWCKECEQGVRIGYRLGDGSKQRVCKKCGTVLD